MCVSVIKNLGGKQSKAKQPTQPYPAVVWVALALAPVCLSVSSPSLLSLSLSLYLTILILLLGGGVAFFSNIYLFPDPSSSSTKLQLLLYIPISLTQNQNLSYLSDFTTSTIIAITYNTHIQIEPYFTLYMKNVKLHIIKIISRKCFSIKHSRYHYYLFTNQRISKEKLYICGAQHKQYNNNVYSIIYPFPCIPTKHPPSLQRQNK